MNLTELAAVPVGNDNREKSWGLGTDYENRVVGKRASARRVLLKCASDDALPVELTKGEIWRIGGDGSAEDTDHHRENCHLAPYVWLRRGVRHAGAPRDRGQEGLSDSARTR